MFSTDRFIIIKNNAAIGFYSDIDIFRDKEWIMAKHSNTEVVKITTRKWITFFAIIAFDI